MSGVLTVGIEGIFRAVTVAEVAGERAERHAVDAGVAGAIRAFDVNGELASVRARDKGEIGIEVLLWRELQVEFMRFREPDKSGREQEFKDFGDDFGIYGEGIDAPINVNEPFDNPLAAFGGDRLRESLCLRL